MRIALDERERASADLAAQVASLTARLEKVQVDEGVDVQAHRAVQAELAEATECVAKLEAELLAFKETGLQMRTAFKQTLQAKAAESQREADSLRATAAELEAQRDDVISAGARADSMHRAKVAALSTLLSRSRNEHAAAAAAAAQASAQLAAAAQARDEAAAAAARAEQAADAAAAEKRAVERDARLVQGRLETELARVKLLLQCTERALGNKAASADEAASETFRNGALAACAAVEAEMQAAAEQMHVEQEQVQPTLQH